MTDREATRRCVYPECQSEADRLRFVFDRSGGAYPACRKHSGLMMPMVDPLAEFCRELNRAEVRVRELEERQRSLFDAIAHGDEKHREWLNGAIEDHFAGRKVRRP